MMKMCCRCHERPAVVFVTKIEGDKTTPEGYCIKCARELNIAPVNDMLNKMKDCSDKTAFLVPKSSLEEMDLEEEKLKTKRITVIETESRNRK